MNIWTDYADRSSPSMERLGLQRHLRKLCEELTACEIVTDASTSVMAMLGKKIICNHQQLFDAIRSAGGFFLVYSFINPTIFINIFNIHLYYSFCLAKDFPHVYHALDIWHKAKKLRKSLLEVDHR